MSVLSILKNVKFDLKLLIPIAILIAFVVDNAHCGGHQQDLEAAEESGGGFEKLPYCDESLMRKRIKSQR